MLRLPKAYGLGLAALLSRLVSDAWIALRSRRAAPEARARVLLVRLDNIGDFLLWRDTARGWREAFPQDKYALTLLCSEACAPLAGDMPEFEQAWPLDKGHFLRDARYRRAQMTALREAGFDVVVQARPRRDLLVEDAITRVTGARERIGFARPPGDGGRAYRLLGERQYTRLAPMGDPNAPEMERSASLVRFAGGHEYASQTPQLTPSAPLPAGLAGRDYFVLFPGADWAGRRWPPERFAEVARRLEGQTGWQGIVCGGPGDRALAEAIGVESGVPLEDWTGRTTLAELAAVMGGARLVVSNETAGAHMAASVGTPCVCILGGGHFGRFLPYKAPPRAGRPLPLAATHPMPCFGCDWNCIYPVPDGAPTPCINNVSVEAVWEHVQTTLTAARRDEATPSPAPKNLTPQA